MALLAFASDLMREQFYTEAMLIQDSLTHTVPNSLWLKRLRTELKKRTRPPASDQSER